MCLHSNLAAHPLSQDFFEVGFLRKVQKCSELRGVPRPQIDKKKTEILQILIQDQVILFGVRFLCHASLNANHHAVMQIDAHVGDSSMCIEVRYNIVFVAFVALTSLVISLTA